MGRQMLLAALTWLTFSGTLATSGFIFKNNESGQSAPRLYRHVAGAVYAAPYGAYSYQIPAISNVHKAAASNIVPMKESFSFQNMNAHLKDSYGNRFVEALQSMKSVPFKPFPQQYVQIQDLPAHFTQPLAAAQNSFPYNKQVSPQIVVGSHYRLPVQQVAPHQIQQFGFSHPGVYADNFKNLAPASHLNSYSSQIVHLPVRPAAASQSHYKFGPTPQEVSHSVSEEHEESAPTAQQQSSSHEAVYADTYPQKQYHHLNGEHKFQRLQEAPLEIESEEEPTPPPRQLTQKEKLKIKVSSTKETPISTFVNGQKTVVNVETKPPLPLLDISLLEPLTFANPLVPQVQHYLPKISQATYHKLPQLEQHDQKKYHKTTNVVQKTKNYDSGATKIKKPKKIAPKKKHKSPEIYTSYDDEYIPQATARPTVTIKGPNEAPEFSYEINSPNYKETYKEKAVKYNKETQSEPVHYTYGSNTHKEPVHYSYTHSSKEPVHIQEVRYEGKGEAPKNLIYKYKPEESHNESEKSKTDSEEDSGESSEHSHDDIPQRTYHREEKENYTPSQGHSKQTHHNEAEHREQEYHHEPSSHHREHKEHHSSIQGSSKPSQHIKAEHREQEYHHSPGSDSHNVQHTVHSSKHAQPAQHHSVDVIPFQPVAQYEEDISLSAPIKVDPTQHVKNSPQQPQSLPSPSPQHYSTANSKPHHETSSNHDNEKPKQVYNAKEEQPEERDSEGEKFMKSMFGKEEDKEKDFENAYKNAAFGFPAYNQPSVDVEKEIYNPESYGVPRDHDTYDIDHSPFQQYQEQGDSFPKEKRLNYKDEKDKMKEEYFLDYSVSKPESLLDRYKNKANYYKLYNNQKPEKIVLNQDDNNKKPKQSEKFTAIPYSFYPVPVQTIQSDNMKHFFQQYKAAPMMFEYDFSKGMPKDNSAFASRPLQMYKMKTHFVEPQFQYGFEPITIPRLLDSELAAMASSPESEKLGTSKKIYKENFYIKKTSLSDASPNS